MSRASAGSLIEGPAGSRGVPACSMRGWLSDLPTAELKYTRWIGERGSINGTCITPTDEADDGRVLKSCSGRT